MRSGHAQTTPDGPFVRDFGFFSDVFGVSVERHLRKKHGRHKEDGMWTGRLLFFKLKSISRRAYICKDVGETPTNLRKKSTPVKHIYI